jgi:hypothetical protein
MKRWKTTVYIAIQKMVSHTGMAAIPGTFLSKCWREYFKTSESGKER